VNVGDIIVMVTSAVTLAGLGWFFFGPRKAAELVGGVQRATVTVRGGYSPEVLRVRQGVPVELEFDRQESGDCTSRVVFPDFQLSAALPAYQQTTVRLDPARAGEFGFACGMNMIHGTLIVEPAAGGAGNGATQGGTDQAATVPGPAASPAACCAVPGGSGGEIVGLGVADSPFQAAAGDL
jgi:Cu+-exporting ATPase